MKRSTIPTEPENSGNPNSALRKELEECQEAAVADRALLAVGLRLALANEELKVENARLRQAAARQGGRSEPANRHRGNNS